MLQLLVVDSKIRARSGTRIGRIAYIRKLGCLVWGGEPEAHRGGSGLATRSRVELAQDTGDVVIDRSLRHHQLIGYLGVSCPIGE